MDRFDAQLQAKIVARNRAGEIANELYPKFLEIFKPYSGQKVCKVDGTLLKKIDEALPDSQFPEDKWPKPTVMYYRSRSEYNIAFTVKTCADDGQGGCAYEEVTVYICDLSNGVIPTDGRWYDPPKCRTDYNLAEVKALREAYKVAKKAADDAQSACHPFGTGY